MPKELPAGSVRLVAAPALAKAPFAGVQAPGVYRLKVGGFEVTVLSDGWLPLEANIFSGDPTTAPKLLEASFLPKDAIPTSVNEWLVNTGDKLVLVDTGTSNLFGPTLGRLAKHLAAAGYDRFGAILFEVLSECIVGREEKPRLPAFGRHGFAETVAKRVCIVSPVHEIL